MHPKHFSTCYWVQKSRIKKLERVPKQTALKILGRLERWLSICFGLLSIAVAKHQPEPIGEEVFISACTL